MIIFVPVRSSAAFTTLSDRFNDGLSGHAAVVRLPVTNGGVARTPSSGQAITRHHTEVGKKLLTDVALEVSEVVAAQGLNVPAFHPRIQPHD